MRIRHAAGAAALALLLALAGCSGSTSPDGDGTSASPSDPGPSAEPTDGASSDAALMLAESPLGEIVVDGQGMTVYMFDNDTQGATTSACTGQCLANWPIVTSDSATPAVEGVTGTVATIDSPDGQKQVTLNGWPLYYFVGDSAAGDTAGQGVNDVWWVLSAAGEKISG
ncbi:hypothetical protein [uncultured Microbacterium sp.]|uniref:Lipoprotein n=1 Tax=uncultured Microbacterium sp. TaxID=191216 RepID=A0A1Y5P1R0_9MICO|nr:hypothetical protein [uncultured Microbacterium sp.]SBS71480.1 conserved exported hypothetical protein [uncultured Microbacterium sp.]